MVAEFPPIKHSSLNFIIKFDSAQNRDYSRALVNAALDLRVSKAMELVS